MKSGRKQTKAPGRLFKLKLELDAYLEKQAAKEHKTLTAFIEELIEFRRSLKQLPSR